ncbi:hypothetical protein FRB94_010291 [Tulasnella sp. JGI-2019a]|nr:hypothetical protein FRB94_010291 [Tulasnella sp. JGI-2019a]
MPPPIAWGRWSVISALIVGTGYVIMRTTTPNEQQMYDALEPDQRRRVDAIRAQRADNERRQALVGSFFGRLPLLIPCGGLGDLISAYFPSRLFFSRFL